MCEELILLSIRMDFMLFTLFLIQQMVSFIVHQMFMMLW